MIFSLALPARIVAAHLKMGGFAQCLVRTASVSPALTKKGKTQTTKKQLKLTTNR